jgi:hypothetical protein
MRKIPNGLIRPALIARFWKHVRPNAFSECWTWVGPTCGSGGVRYGQVWAGKLSVRAHRLSFEIHRGPIPDGLFVCHHCDNPTCTSPDHLFLGTPADNTQDMMRKNRCSRLGRRRPGLPNSAPCPSGHTGDFSRRVSERGKRKCNECNRVRAALNRAKKRQRLA